MRMTCPRRARPSRTSGEIRPSTVSTPGSYACGWTVHGNERARTRALGDTRAIAARPSAPFEAPRVSRLGELGIGASKVDQPAAERRVAFLEKALDRDVDVLGIAKEALAVCGRELERLDVAMQELESPRPHPRDVEAFEQVQRHRHERALRPRTAGVHVDAAV